MALSVLWHVCAFKPSDQVLVVYKICSCEGLGTFDYWLERYSSTVMFYVYYI